MIQPDLHSKYPKKMLRLRKHESPGPKILLDVSSEKVRPLSQQIKALDGQYICSKFFEKNATHLITDIVKCNEKFLGACVRGLWVLPPEYIKDSYEVGMWLREEDYDHKFEHMSNSLVSAARRWRERISKYAKQPFTGLHVALLMTANSEDYKKLLIFGGAQVHKLSLPLRADNNVSKISYVFMDQSYKDHVCTLTEYGLICLHYTFIVDTIIKDEELDILEYVVREDTDTSWFPLGSLSCVAGQKSVRICNISQSSQTNIQTIKVMDGVHSVVDLTGDSELPRENPHIKASKSKASKVTQLAVVSSSCISHNSTGSVNTSTKDGLSRIGNDYAHLKNVTNLCRKQNALTESKDNRITGSQRTCDDKPDILKVSVQKNALKELNDPPQRQKIHEVSLSESMVSSTGKYPDGISLDTGHLKTQHSVPETMKKCIKFNEDSYTKTAISSSSIKQPIQQTAIKNLEGQEGKSKSSSSNNSSVHVSDLSYQLNPSIYLSRNDDDDTLCSATSSTDATEGKSCLQDTKKKTVKRIADSHSESGLQEEPIKKGSQHGVINVCLLQKKLSSRSKEDGQQCNSNNDSCLHPLPLVQVNIQLHDCQSNVQQTPHVVIKAKRVSQIDNSADNEIWENTDVNSQEHGSLIVSHSDVQVGTHVDKSGYSSSRHSDKCASGNSSSKQYNEEKSGHFSQKNKCKLGSTADRQDSENKHRSLFNDIINVDKDVVNTRMPLRSATSSRQGSEDKLESVYSRQEIEDENNTIFSDIICIDDDDDDMPNTRTPSESTSTSGRQDNTDKHGSTSDRQDNTNKHGSTSGRQDTENKHRSLFNDIICGGDDMVIARMPLESESIFTTQGNENKSRSICDSQNNADKNKSFLPDIIYISDDDDEDSMAETRMLFKSKSTSNMSNKDEDESTFDRQDNAGRQRSLWTDFMHVDDKPSEVRNSESSSVNPSSPPLQPIAVMDRLHPSTSSAEASCPQNPSTPEMHKFSPWKAKPASSQRDMKLSPAALLTKSKNVQTNLQRFGFSSVGRKSNDSESKDDLSFSKAAQSTTSLKRTRKRKKSGIAVLKAHTRRGLAKRRSLDTTLSCAEITVKEECPEWTSGSGEEESSVAVERIGSNVCGTVRSAAGDYIKMDRPSVESQSSNSKLAQQIKCTQRGLAKRRAVDTTVSQTTVRECPAWPSGHKETECSMAVERAQSNVNVSIKMRNPSLQSQLSSTESSSSSHQTAKHTHPGLAKRRSVDGSDVQNSSQESNSSERSLFGSFHKLFTDTISEPSCSDDIHFKSVLESDQGLSSELTASADVHTASTVSKNVGNIKDLCLFRKVNVSGNTATAAESLSCDYMDLPTPPSVVCHSDVDAAEPPTAVIITSEAVTGELSLACNPSVAKECVLNKVQQHAQIQGKICNRKHLEPSTSAQSSESFPLWPLTYWLPYNTDHSQCNSFLPVLYGQLMESSRELGFFDQAVSHARPTQSRLPTSLMLSELVQLARTDGDVCPQAVNYLYSWLELHPPLAPLTVRLYTEAFDLSSENSVLFEILSDIMDDSKQSTAILLLEYFISVFEINFNFSLKSRDKSILRKCLIIKWLWRDSFTIVRGRTIPRLLEIFEYIIAAPLLNYRACNAACALLSLACECLRLANIQWDHQNPQFVIDSVINVSHAIAQRIHSSFQTGDKARRTILNLLRPAWLKLLVAAKLLSYYNNYLLADPVHVSCISMNSIVSQFFLLVPLESSGKSEAHDHEHSEGHTSKHSAETLDARKPKGQKGIFTAEKVNKRNGKGESAIHIACMKNKTADLAKLLQVPGADVNLRDNSGWTPLHEACHHGNVACVELLLKHVPRAPGGASASQEQTSDKVEIDAQGPDGFTPLHDAVCNNKIDVCKLLLRYGGQKLLKTKTHNNITAIDLASSDEMKAVLSGSSEESSLFDLSISQDLDDPARISDAVRDIAPLTQRYTEVTGTDCRRMASLSSCEEFLMFLTVLVSSYYNILGSLEESGLLDPVEKNVLENMNMHLRLFRRHLKKLTRPEDFDQLQFRLECFESLCIYKPGSVYF